MLLVYSIIGFLGLITGAIFRKKFKEEVSEKYFSLIKLFLLVVISSILLFNFGYYLIIGALIGFLAYFLIKNIYLYLGFIILLGFNETAGLLSGFVFIFGLFEKFKLKYLLYFLPLIFLLFSLDKGLVSGVIIGGILGYVRNNKRIKK